MGDGLDFIAMRAEQNKDGVVRIMTNCVVEMNRQQGYAAGMPVPQIEMLIEQSIPELNRVNRLVLEELIKHGVARV